METSLDLTRVLPESYLYLISFLLETLGSICRLKLATSLPGSYLSLISVLLHTLGSFCPLKLALILSESYQGLNCLSSYCSLIENLSYSAIDT